MFWNADESIKCVTPECNKPAKNKTMVLCLSCYQRALKTGMLPPLKRTKNLETKDIYIDNAYSIFDKRIQHSSEITFAQKHSFCLYQPASFNLGMTKYTPDFYDPRENIFYEIIGTRQRFHQLKDKLKLFKNMFPNIILKICCADGNDYNTKDPDLV